jgi:type II secretory pathway pseudopilin PulG
LLSRPYQSEMVQIETRAVLEGRSAPRRSHSGYSVIEMFLAVTAILIISAFAIPAFQRIANGFLLKSAAQSVSDLIERARYEAIKQNTKISCHFALAAAPPMVWIDVNRTGVLAANDPRAYYRPPVFNAAPGGWVPGPASLGFPNTTQVVNGGVITFDSRGAVDFTGVPGGPTVWLLYFTFNGDQNYGARAISVEPLGRSKVWSASAGGAATWHNP